MNDNLRKVTLPDGVEVWLKVIEWIQTGNPFDNEQVLAIDNHGRVFFGRVLNESARK